VKTAITETKIVGVKEMLSDLKRLHFAVAEEYALDDSYTDGVDLYSILTVKQGKSLGEDRNTWHLADNTDINVIPMGLAFKGSRDRHLAGLKEFKKFLPAKEEILTLPPIDVYALIIEGYDTNGKRVYPTFELEDLRKPVYLGKQGKITFTKPSSTEFNSPIGYIASRDTVIIDLSQVNKHNTPVSKN